jgi:hypothetical protein
MKRPCLNERAKRYALDVASDTLRVGLGPVAEAGYLAGYRAAKREARDAFDRVMDYMYEYDLGEQLPPDWPADLRRQINAARKRLMLKRGGPT